MVGARDETGVGDLFDARVAAQIGNDHLRRIARPMPPVETGTGKRGCLLDIVAWLGRKRCDELVVNAACDADGSDVVEK